MIFQTAWLVARKDLLIERRSRVMLWQVLPFGIIALLLCGLAVGPSPDTMRHAAPGLFYLVTLLVALLAINRSQAVESSSGTRTSIKMLGLDPAGVFVGKTLALFVVLVVNALILIAGTVLIMHVPLSGTIRALPSVLVALLALSSAGIMYGSLVGDVRASATLLPVVALPPFAGILIIGEKAFAAAVVAGSFWKWMGILVSAAAAYLAAGILLYGVAEESP